MGTGKHAGDETGICYPEHVIFPQHPHWFLLLAAPPLFPSSPTPRPLTPTYLLIPYHRVSTQFHSSGSFLSQQCSIFEHPWAMKLAQSALLIGNCFTSEKSPLPSMRHSHVRLRHSGSQKLWQCV